MRVVSFGSPSGRRDQMTFCIGRREFITLLGSAAAWPLAARGQQSERMRRVGVITNALADDPAAQSRLTAFVQGLQQLGWSDSRNVRIDTRWGAGDTERVRRYAAELVALAPDVILTVGSPTTGPARFNRFHHRRFAFAAVPFVAGVGLYGGSCWSWQPTPWGWQRGWACDYDYG